MWSHFSVDLVPPRCLSPAPPRGSFLGLPVSSASPGRLLLSSKGSSSTVGQARHSHDDARTLQQGVSVVCLLNLLSILRVYSFAHCNVRDFIYKRAGMLMATLGCLQLWPTG